MVTIKRLDSSKIKDTMLDSFQRDQATTKVLVNESGSLVEKEDTFEDEWHLARKREIVQHFRHVIDQGGAVIVANDDAGVVGFAVIEPGEFGQHSCYRELSYIHVSNEHRGKGIGKELFKVVTSVAIQLGADKLYIGAHPSIETQGFYSRMGCVLAEEINEEIYMREPRDIQLEYIL
ncbi:GNAT family N-acetyltransferase [Guptibacillus algicola]|uniref:GNAT family N-acetyltransferase n=1 Tax=Guptibacillus algicola TaxID=225844 RepID=UPI001CD53024|nr:GNAT family N-acetyltransferase [Alkalihalobacillus algicola]MCA0987230.1 GNAT family N-acetyltransferase [Alkalihalobacillus algicola]